MYQLIIGPFLIFVGGYIGFAVSKRFQNRVKQLESMAVMLQRIRVYLEYEQTPTKLLIQKLSQSESLSDLCFLKRCAEKMGENPNFAIAWQESIRKVKTQLALEEEDYDILMQLAELLGVYDVQAQISGILVLETMVKQQIEEATEQYKTMGKLYRSLGVLGGIAVAILVV